MELTVFAQGINSVFYQLDYAILSFYHTLAAACGWLYYLLYPITLTGWKGAFLIVLSIVMICFRKTRKTGLCCLLGLAIGATFTNVIIKNAVARPRPYDFDTTLREWWVYAGAHVESDLSFPSGHMTAACAFTSAFVLVRGKKWLPWGILYVLLMGVSRNYLIVHYPSDVLGGLVFGCLGGALSFLIISAVYRKWGESRFLHE